MRRRHAHTRWITFPAMLLITLAGASTSQSQLFSGPGIDIGFGGTGFSGAGAYGVVGIMIEPSASGKTLYGYSDEVGEWDKLAADPHPVDGLAFIQTNNLGVARSKGHVHAFGMKYGKWISIETDGDPGVPVLSAGVAGCIAGTHLYGIGPISEEWAALDIGEPVDAEKLKVSVSRIVYRTKTHIHVFSAASSKWASVDLSKD